MFSNWSSIISAISPYSFLWVSNEFDNSLYLVFSFVIMLLYFSSLNVISFISSSSVSVNSFAFASSISTCAIFLIYWLYFIPPVISRSIIISLILSMFSVLIKSNLSIQLLYFSSILSFLIMVSSFESSEGIGAVSIIFFSLSSCSIRFFSLFDLFLLDKTIMTIKVIIKSNITVIKIVLLFIQHLYSKFYTYFNIKIEFFL